jgi:hypothetical protein
MKIDAFNRPSVMDSTACWLAVIAFAAMLLARPAQADDLPPGLADPTRPAYAGQAPAGTAGGHDAGPVLQSTFISANQRRAVIDGRTYTVGDQFGGAVVVEIRPYEVVLQRLGRTTQLRLLPKLARQVSTVKIPAYSQEQGGQK